MVCLKAYPDTNLTFSTGCYLNVGAGHWRTTSHASEPFVIGFLADPFGNMATRFRDEHEAGVELVSHNALVLPIVVADAKVPFGDPLNIDWPAIFERKIHVGEQSREIVLLFPDDNRVLAAAQLPEAVFDQRPSPQLRHKPTHTSADDSWGRLNTMWMPMVP